MGKGLWGRSLQRTHFEVSPSLSKPLEDPDLAISMTIAIHPVRL